MNVSLWKRAAETDPTLRLTPGVIRELPSLELKPQHYTRKKFFSAMARQEVMVYDDYPLRASLKRFFDDRSPLGDRLRVLFKASPKTLAKLGPSRRRKYLPVEEVIDHWERGRRVISANDVFYRDLKLDQTFNCEAIADFSILPTSPPEVSHLEVATLLMGTAGCMSDSHTDDPDGSNHCITGNKLWMVWDRREGQEHGLQDTEYDDVIDRAAFDLKTFLKLRSARWFTMSDGRTLYMPGCLTHKVITLERYLGISSFYVGLPNALSSLSRWKLEGTIMIDDGDRDAIARLLIDRLDQVTRGDRACKIRWGLSHLGESWRHWDRKYDQEQKDRLRADLPFRELEERIRRITRPLPRQRHS